MYEVAQGRPPLRPGLAVRRTDLAGASIGYDQPTRRPVPQLQARDMEIMRALWRYAFLTTSQIGETWWSERHPSRAQIRLAELASAGLLLRFRPIVKRGTHQWIYQLARDGFRAAQRAYGPDGTYISESARWTERRAADISVVEQILRVNGWMLGYRLVLGERMLDWRGTREARTAAEAEEPVTPDAAARLDLSEDLPPLELLVELAREERPVRFAERLLRYDALLNRWWRSVPRFQHSGAPPAVVLIARGYREVDRLLRRADRVATGVTRGRLVFCAETDVHRGDLRAWTLPRGTPNQRESSDLTALAVNLPG